MEYVAFPRNIDCGKAEYTFGGDESFWSFDYVVSEDGDFVALGVQPHPDGDIIAQVFRMQEAMEAAVHAVNATGISLQAMKVPCDFDNEASFIKDTFLSDLQLEVDAWWSRQLQAEGKLN